jgi:hypothetical protein
MAQSGHPAALNRCPLLGVKRTCGGQRGASKKACKGCDGESVPNAELQYSRKSS